jgi:hypothetical protein
VQKHGRNLMMKYFKITVYLLQQEVYPMLLEELDSKHFYTPHILEKEWYIYPIHCIVYTRLLQVQRGQPQQLQWRFSWNSLLFL